MMISRSSTVVWAFVLFAVAVYSVHAGGKGHVVEIGLSIASVAYGCLLGVFLLGTLTRYATQTGAIIGMITGFALNAGSVAPTSRHHHRLRHHHPHIAFTWYVLIGAIVTFAVGSHRQPHLRNNRHQSRQHRSNHLARLLSTSSIPNSCHSEAQRRTSAFRPQPSHNSIAAPDFTAVSALINQAIATKKLPGAVVLVGHNGKVVFEQAYGDRKYAGRTRPQRQTIAPSP